MAGQRSTECLSHSRNVKLVQKCMYKHVCNVHGLSVNERTAAIFVSLKDIMSGQKSKIRTMMIP